MPPSKLAAKLVHKDILTKMKISWPPDRASAERILRRLHEKKQEFIRPK